MVVFQCTAHSLLLTLLSLIFFLLLIYLQWREVSFTKRVLIALFLGIIIGFLGHFLLPCESKKYGFMQLLSFVGDAYIALLKMIVIPLIFTSLISAILSLSQREVAEFGKSAVRFIVLLLLMTAISAGIGMLVASLMHLGENAIIPAGVEAPHKVGTLAQTLIGLLPSNPVKDMVNGNAAALAIFAVLFGCAAFVVKKRKLADVSSFENFMQSGFEVSKQLARFVIALTPYGVMALLGLVFITTGKATLMTMLNYVFVMYLSMILVLVMQVLLVWTQGITPVAYFKGVYQALLVAFTTQSSLGALPVTQSVLRNKMNVHQDIASFAPTMGASMGMNACAGVFPAVLVTIAMTVSHYPITWESYLMIMIVNSIASLGLSGIPGTAFVAASVTLSTLGLPFGVLALVQGIDSLVDMGRTATNVSGVMSAAIVIDRQYSKHLMRET